MALVINKKIIETPIIDILFELKAQLYHKGINKLNSIQNKGDYARITCPSHKNGQESHPSCSVFLNSNKGFEQGFVRCFTCGYAVNLAKFISNCFEINDNGEYGEQWLLDTCKYSLIDENRQRIKIPTLNFKLKTNNEFEYVSEKELESYRVYHPYMWQRKLTPEVVDKFDIGYDSKTNSITFPVYNNEGNCLFVIKRNTQYKYFQIPEGVKKEIFGLNHITSDINKVIICESVINALTCWTYGKPAIALFGTGTSEQIETLLNSHVRHFVLGFDGDSAGRNATSKFYNKLRKTKIVTEYHLPEGKDINDLSKEQFDKLIEY